MYRVKNEKVVRLWKNGCLGEKIMPIHLRILDHWIEYPEAVYTIGDLSKELDMYITDVSKGLKLLVEESIVKHIGFRKKNVKRNPPKEFILNSQKIEDLLSKDDA